MCKCLAGRLVLLLRLHLTWQISWSYFGKLGKADQGMLATHRPAQQQLQRWRLTRHCQCQSGGSAVPGSLCVWHR
jgi:hypothetical protein